MNLKILFISLIITLLSCKKEELVFDQGDLKIELKPGENWLHDFPLFLGVKQKNPPQFAIWLEDTNGNYIATVYATKKIATQGWIANGGNRRKETLPHWCFKRGVVYEDGLMLPTKNNPLPDAETGATPKYASIYKYNNKDIKNPIVIKAEFNHSIDFNESFPKTAKEKDENYSGGEMGSGQPAVIYVDTIYPFQTDAELKLTGRSSSDGTNGNIYTDLDNLTTAKSIVSSILVTIYK